MLEVKKLELDTPAPSPYLGEGWGEGNSEIPHPKVQALTIGLGSR
jgi:hypothetical protein